MNAIKPVTGSKEDATESALLVAKVRPDKDWFIYKGPNTIGWTFTDTPHALPIGNVFEKVFSKTES